MLDHPNCQVKYWSELSTDLLYEIMQLRQKVFIVEQECPYLDADGKDKESYHITAYHSGKLIAYSRLLPQGISYQEYTSIGRVVIDPDYRGYGWGYPLMQYSIDKCLTLWPKKKIKISAQAHLKAYYIKCGFKYTGEEYLEDNIPHIGMVYDINE